MQNFNVLIVDDDSVNLKLLDAALSNAGYRVVAASDGPQARLIVSEWRPDLILLDIMMPGEDGFEVIQRLKEKPYTANIPVIFLTAVDKVEDKVTAFELGAVDYIIKPFHIREVLSRVRLHLKLSIATNSLIANQAEKLRQIQSAQISMLTVPEDFPDANFGVYYLSLQEAGGDFYDVLKISDSIFGYFVGDISGHDIATSYITAALKALLKQNCVSVYEPTESLKMINNVLTDVLPEGKYLTATYARLNRKTKMMTIINGGHPPVVYLPRDGDARMINLQGDVLGIFNDIHLGHEDIKVSEGDRFYLYSDGLIEDPGDGKVWTGGLDRLLSVFGKLKNIPIGDSVQELTELILGETSQAEDDVVVLGIEV